MKRSAYDPLTIEIPETNHILVIEEGAGDNLTHEDIAAGYRDYIEYNLYQKDTKKLVDGGEFLLTDLFRDLYDSTESAVSDLLDFIYDKTYPYIINESFLEPTA